MKSKEYEMPDGKKAVFEYDDNGVGKITLECMDMLMGLINDRKTEPQTNTDQRTQCVESVETMSCQECKHWIFDDRWGWFCPLKSQDECRYEPKDEQQTDCTTCDQVGRCERGRAVECPLTERSE